jgi:hypothetical protein
MVAPNHNELGAVAEDSRVTKHTLELWIGVARGSVLLCSTLPTMAIKTVEVEAWRVAGLHRWLVAVHVAVVVDVSAKHDHVAANKSRSVEGHCWREGVLMLGVFDFTPD